MPDMAGPGTTGGQCHIDCAYVLYIMCPMLSLCGTSKFPFAVCVLVGHEQHASIFSIHTVQYLHSWRGRLCLPPLSDSVDPLEPPDVLLAAADPIVPVAVVRRVGVL